MYFVKAGQLEAFSEETGEVLSVMKDGTFFGEIALLNEVRRTASVKTLTYCELFVLEREDFEQEMEDYPDFAKHVQAVAESRQR
jgi:CRP-like cAMP-binding protein